MLTVGLKFVVVAGLALYLGGTPLSAQDPWETRAVVGIQQTGAASTEASQDFFFDFYVARGLGKDKNIWDNRVSWWGNVRLASAPVQADTTVSRAVTDLSGLVGDIKANEMARAGEFQTGIDIRVGKFGDDTSERIKTLSIIAFYGASGAFSPPDTRLRVYTPPSAESAQRPAFESEINRLFELVEQGASKEAVLAATTKGDGFAPPDRDQFYRMWGVGPRLAVYDPDSAAGPATVSFTIGRDESITAGTFSSAVGRIDALYPLPLTGGALFLFGTVNLRLFDRTGQRTPLLMEQLQVVEATGELPAGQISRSDPNLAIVSAPSNRDSYRIGFGIDLVGLLGKLKESQGGGQ